MTNAPNRETDRTNLFAILSPDDIEGLQKKLDAVALSDPDQELIKTGDARDMHWNEHDFDYWSVRILKACDEDIITSCDAAKMLLYFQAQIDCIEPEEGVHVLQLVKDDGTIDYASFLRLTQIDRRGHLYRATFDKAWHRKLSAAENWIGTATQHEVLNSRLLAFAREKGICATQIFYSYGELVIPPALLGVLLSVRFGSDAAMPAPVIGGLSPASRFENIDYRDMAIPVPESLQLPFPEEIHGDYYPRKIKAYHYHDTEHLIQESSLTRLERIGWVQLAKVCRNDSRMYHYLLDKAFQYNVYESRYERMQEDVNTALVKSLSYYQDSLGQLSQSALQIFVCTMMDMPGFNHAKFSQIASRFSLIEKRSLDRILSIMELFSISDFTNESLYLKA